MSYQLTVGEYTITHAQTFTTNLHAMLAMNAHNRQRCKSGPAQTNPNGWTRVVRPSCEGNVNLPTPTNLHT